MKRKGFGIITAIIIMMTIATLMSLMVGLSTSSTKHTSDVYLKQQGELVLRSAMEFTLLAISGHNKEISCLESIEFKDFPFVANVDIWYLGSGLSSTCSKVVDDSLMTQDSNLTALIDIVVELDPAANLDVEPIRLHRRTIQKP